MLQPEKDQCNILISLKFTFDRGLQFEMNLTTKIVNLAKSIKGRLE